MQRWKSGDATAFAAILERHQAPLLRYASRLLQCGDAAAEDVVQETFLRLVRSAPSLNGELHADGALPAWLFRVCRNLCADVSRKELRMQQRHLRVAVPDLDPPPLPAFEQIEEHNKVKELLHELPETEREILVLKILDGKSYREIQALLGVSLHEVFTTAHRALRRLATGLRAAGLA